MFLLIVLLQEDRQSILAILFHHFDLRLMWDLLIQRRHRHRPWHSAPGGLQSAQNLDFLDLVFLLHLGLQHQDLLHPHHHQIHLLLDITE